jgi:hypothetical protein
MQEYTNVTPLTDDEMEAAKEAQESGWEQDAADILTLDELYVHLLEHGPTNKFVSGGLIPGATNFFALFCV